MKGRAGRRVDRQPRRLVLALVACAALAAAGVRAGATPQGPGPVLVLGDSLSAGYGIALEEGWVSLLQQRLRDRAPPLEVVNASISGDTTAGGRARIGDALARHRPSAVIVELGGNDGLRGIAPSQSQANLEAIVTACREAGARVLVLGVRLPPNYGPAYIERFAAMFQAVADATGAALVPRFLEGVADDPALMQPDGIHPVAAAQSKMLDNVWPALQPLLGP